MTGNTEYVRESLALKEIYRYHKTSIFICRERRKPGVREMAAKKEAQKNGVERKLIEYSRRPEEEIFEIFKTETDGLNQVEAAERL